MPAINDGPPEPRDSRDGDWIRILGTMRLLLVGCRMMRIVVGRGRIIVLLVRIRLIEAEQIKGLDTGKDEGEGVIR